MNAANRIILNTAVTYSSLIIKMIIGFFSVRLVLQALGESDYGVYTIVAGVAGMLEILNGNMTNTSMRYMAYSLGSNSSELIKKTFSTTLAIHYLVGALTIIVMEAGGFLMFKFLLNIPPDKVRDAIIIYQFMVVSSFISIIAVPYDAVMNAHEHIWILSIFDILSALFNLAMALFLVHTGGNKLIIYGFLMLLIQIALRGMKYLYSRHYYSECQTVSRSYIDHILLKEIVSFTGWNFLGSLAALGATQFRSIIINMFFGVRLNAAEGIARQSSGYINMFTASMTRAINPQIMKSEGSGDHKKMLYITEIGAKYSSFLFALMGIPLAIEAHLILNLWLKEVPQYTVIFFQLLIIQMLVEKFTFQITHAIRAVGTIRDFQIFESLACFVYLPVSYVMFKHGYPPETIYILGIINCFIVAIVRLYYGYRVAGINVNQYIKVAILPILVPLILALIFCFTINSFLEPGIVTSIMRMCSFCIMFTVLFYWTGMNHEEKKMWSRIIMGLLKK